MLHYSQTPVIKTAGRAANDQATVIPVDAVFYEDLSPVVFLWRNGEPLRVPVVLGAGDAQYVQVTEGLTAEQKVMLVYPDSFEIAAVD